MDEVLPTGELRARVAEFTRILATRSLLTQAAAKEFASPAAGADGPGGADAGAAREAHWAEQMRASGDTAEGVAAFLERRQPRFAWTPPEVRLRGLLLFAEPAATAEHVDEVRGRLLGRTGVVGRPGRTPSSAARLGASSPAILPTSARPMSMPDDTPAAVTYFPSNTTRCPVERTPTLSSSSRASQCDVASRPFRSPAAARAREPVHTDVVQVVVLSVVRSQPSSDSFSIWSLWPGPPGTTTMSGLRTSSNDLSATRVSWPVSSRTARPARPRRRPRRPGCRRASGTGRWRRGP
ncbi:enoyl-CoA hydratase [Streptomyces alboflavus]|uniref:Enoyl-CoA hydratase n=1 Tax=Streptomyces alboflavus TaxID=67267 RepID=A0A1Z1WN66_9ACTN|nr:enoyl-CoA hydratase [Streptomyces alboflavus]